MRLFWVVVIAAVAGVGVMAWGEDSARAPQELEVLAPATTTPQALPSPAPVTPVRPMARIDEKPPASPSVALAEPGKSPVESEMTIHDFPSGPNRRPHQVETKTWTLAESRASMKDMVRELRSLKQGSPEFNAVKDQLYSALDVYISALEAADPLGIDQEFVADLGSMLDSDVEAAHWASMWALGNLAYRGQRLTPPDSLLQRVIGYAESGTASERPVAVEALDRLRDVRACPQLLKLAEGDDPALAGQARQALGGLMSAYPVEGAGVDVRLWWERLPADLKNPPSQDSPAVHSYWRSRKR